MTDRRLKDWEWLNPVVVQAFEDNRIELGVALARLVGQAYRVAQDSEPMPAVPVVPGPIYESVVRSVPAVPAVEVPAPQLHTCHLGVSDPDHPLRTDQAHCPVCQHRSHSGEQLSSDFIAAPAPVPSENARVIPSARCIALVGPAGKKMECHKVLAWHGPSEFWPTGGWEHLHEVDDHHTPEPDRPDPEDDPCSGGRCPDPEAHAEGAHDV